MYIFVVIYYFDICDLENIVKCVTCFTKGADPTLIDVILTNRKSILQNVMNFSCGLSDVHNLIAVQIKSNTPSQDFFVFCIYPSCLLILFCYIC
jgi:hypothetical protein